MTEDNVIDFENSIIDKEIVAVYEQVIDTCNKILSQARIYGFSFMHLPNPNIHSIIFILDNVVIPTLDKIISCGSFAPESGIKIANIKQYTLHIREIAVALESGDTDRFHSHVTTLNNESLLFCM